VVDREINVTKDAEKHHMRALVLSGGGSKGAFQAGALEYIMGVQCIKYDIYCGVSVGALNAALLAMHPTGEELLASKLLIDEWRNIRTRDVRKEWSPFGILHAFWKPSVYNSQPLSEMLHNKLNANRLRTSGKRLAVGAVSLATGEYHVFHETHPEIEKAVLASASFPAMLCPVRIGDELFIDGGVRDVTPVYAAILLGATDIDIIMTSPEGPVFGIDESLNAIDVATKSIDILSNEVLENDIKIASLVTELVNAGLRHDKKSITMRIIRPISPLPGNTLDFEKKDLDAMIALGNEAARRAGWSM
jgi:NTE family protein